MIFLKILVPPWFFIREVGEGSKRRNKEGDVHLSIIWDMLRLFWTTMLG